MSCVDYVVGIRVSFSELCKVMYNKLEDFKLHLDGLIIENAKNHLFKSISNTIDDIKKDIVIDRFLPLELGCYELTHDVDPNKDFIIGMGVNTYDSWTSLQVGINLQDITKIFDTTRQKLNEAGFEQYTDIKLYEVKADCDCC